MRNLAITSAGLFSLSVGKIKRIGIVLPPVGEQHRIVAKVDELMMICDRIEVSLRLGEERRFGLLTATLDEALRPAEERDEAA